MVYEDQQVHSDGELKECGTFFGTPLIWEGSVEQAPPYRLWIPVFTGM